MKKTIQTLIAGLLITAPASAQVVVGSWGFETPILPPLTVLTYPAGSSLDGWNVQKGSISIYNLPGFAIEGKQSAVFQKWGSVFSRQITLQPTEPGWWYELEAKVSRFGTTEPVWAFLAVVYDGNMSKFLGIQIWGGIEVVPSAGTIKLPFTLNVTDTVTVSLIPLTDLLAIDELKLTYVPEPHTYALAVGLGLIAYAGYRRVRKS